MTLRRSLRPFGRLDRYVGTLFVSSYSTALLLVVGLFWILDLASHVDQFFEPWPDGTVVGSGTIVRYELLNLPFLFLQVAPLVTLVAGMFTVNRLLRAREVVGVLGAGISAHRLLLPALIGGVLAAAGMFGIREWLSVSLSSQRDALLDVLENRRWEPTYEALWLRDLSGNNVRLGVFHPGAVAKQDQPASEPWAEDLEAILRDDRGVTNVRAKRATWDGDGWALEGSVSTRVGVEKEVAAPERLEGFAFTPRLARTYRRARDNPLELSFSEVRDLMARDPDNVIYQTLLQYHMTFPLANLVLLLVVLPVMLGYERGKGTERMAIGGGLALFYFALDFVFRNLGLEGGLSPVLASWVPLLVFGSLGVVLFDSMKT